jgi:hypothetical protein
MDFEEFNTGGSRLPLATKFFSGFALMMVAASANRLSAILNRHIWGTWGVARIKFPFLSLIARDE